MKTPSPATAISLVALCIAITTPAWSAPAATGAASLTANVKKALKLSKAADKRSKRADRRSRQALAKALQVAPVGGSPGAGGQTGVQGPPGPQGPAGPSGSIQSAAAGGDLTGTYPNPALAAGSVGNDELADGSVDSAKLGIQSVGLSEMGFDSVGTGSIINGQVFNPDLAPNSVSAGKLGGVVLREAQVVVDATGQTEGNGSYETRYAEVLCQGSERPIAVGTRWQFIDGAATDDNDELTTTFAGFTTTQGGAPNGARARGGNDTDESRTFVVQVLCLQ